MRERAASVFGQTNIVIVVWYVSESNLTLEGEKNDRKNMGYFSF